MVPRRIQIAVIVVTSWLVASCGPMQDSSSALVTLDGNVYVNKTRNIEFAIQETPNPTDPDAFKLMAASPYGMQAGTVRFCFGDLAGCQAGTAISVQGVNKVSNGKTIFESDKYVKVAAELQIHIFGRNNAGQDMVQSYQIKPKGFDTTSTAGGDTASSSGGDDSTSSSGDTTQNTGTNQSQTDSVGECYGAPNDTVCRIEVAVWRLTNEKRQSQGLQPFTFAKKIGCASRLWSVEMGKRGRISHQWFSNGQLRQKYVSDCQGTGQLQSENVAMAGGGGNDPDAVARQFVEMWWNSPGHKANMLGNYKSMGVGFAQTGNAWYGTQNMGAE